MEDKYTQIMGKIVSDTLFSVSAFTILLGIRKQSLRNANLTQRLSPISTSILQYERTHNIQSTLYYSQRFTAYMILGGIVSGTCQYYDSNGVGTLLKATLWGVCFGLVKSSVVVGMLGGALYNVGEEMLKEYL